MVFVLLTCFTLYENLQDHLCCCKWHYFILFFVAEQDLIVYMYHSFSYLLMDIQVASMSGCTACLSLSTSYLLGQRVPGLCSFHGSGENWRESQQTLAMPVSISALRHPTSTYPPLAKVSHVTKLNISENQKYTWPNLVGNAARSYDKGQGHMIPRLGRYSKKLGPVTLGNPT